MLLQLTLIEAEQLAGVERKQVSEANIQRLLKMV